MEEFIVKLVDNQPVLFEEVKTEEPGFFEFEDKKFATSYIRLGSVSADSNYSLAERYSVRDLTKVNESTVYSSGKRPIITSEYKIEKKINKRDE